MDFVESLETVPADGRRQRRRQPIEFLPVAPPQVKMLVLGQGEVPPDGPGPVYHANVLVGFSDPVDVEETRGDQRSGARAGRGRTLTQQLDEQSTFLKRLAQRRRLGVFVGLDVPAQRQPLTQPSMMHQQNPVRFNHKNRHREVDFLVPVRHVGRDSGEPA